MSYFGSYHYQFLSGLTTCGVRFMIVGGQAAIYYGVRRGTGDLDILIEPTQKNGKLLIEAFNMLKLEVDDLKPEEFENQLFLGLGFEPDAVDIFTITAGIDFETAYRNSIVIQDGNLSVHVIALQDLIKNKESLNRGGEKQKLDEYDVAVLKRIQREKS